ncbi:hypothetical protein JTE90_023567 [Oedothorax gibbosus]|uniref:Uncharacterized protein n=1 Tax=Oedothorax gibbosus TaxID=931172 RepID=A0AAV6UCD9_9ARAC|nr:hypothetical protein JTE90_023567 [Oedothorax gibbosus]
MTAVKMLVRNWLLVCLTAYCVMSLVHAKALPREERDDKPDIYDIILDKLITIVITKVRNYVYSFIPFIG